MRGHSAKEYLAVAALLIASPALALAPHDKAIGVQTKRQPKDGVQAQQNTTGEPHSSTKTVPVVPGVHALSGNGERQGKAEENSEEGTEFWPPLFGYRLKVTDTIIAAFTALLFIATIALWWSTRRLVRGADKTAERQLRAYVNVVDSVISSTKSIARFSLVYKNFGDTPAYEIEGWHRILFEHPNFDGPFENPGEDILHFGLLPPGHVNNYTITFTTPLADQQFARISGSESAIFCYGMFIYLDSFGKKRTTKYRLMFGKTQFEAGDGRMSYCHKGNEAD